MTAEPVMDWLVPKPVGRRSMNFFVGGVEVQDHGAALYRLVRRPPVGQYAQRGRGVEARGYFTQPLRCAAPGEGFGWRCVAKRGHEFRADSVIKDVFGVVQDDRLPSVPETVQVKL